MRHSVTATAVSLVVTALPACGAPANTGGNTQSCAATGTWLVQAGYLPLDAGCLNNINTPYGNDHVSVNSAGNIQLGAGEAGNPGLIYAPTCTGTYEDIGPSQLDSSKKYTTQDSTSYTMMFEGNTAVVNGSATITTTDVSTKEAVTCTVGFSTTAAVQ